jgi:hypothetical protein
MDHSAGADQGDALLPGEVKEAFEKRYAAAQREMDSDGLLEDDAVNQVIRGQSVSSHLQNMITKVMQRMEADLSAFSAEDLEEERRKTLKAIRGIRKIAMELTQIVAQKIDAETRNLNNCDKPTVASLRSAIQEFRTTVDFLNLGQRQFIIADNAYKKPALDTIFDEGIDRLIKLAKLLSMTEARIDRNLARFVNLKEYKRIEASREKPKRLAIDKAIELKDELIETKDELMEADGLRKSDGEEPPTSSSSA